MTAPKNLVWETTSGTASPYTLNTVARSFDDAFGTGGTDVFTAFMYNRDAPGEWMVCTGHLSDASTLVVDTVIEGANGTSEVAWSAGTKDVTCDAPASEQEIASQPEAEAGADNEKQMTPLRVTQAIAAKTDLLFAQLMLGLADAANIAQFMGDTGNRFADSFDALTYVDTGGATNLDTGTAGTLKPTVSGGSTSYANSGGTGNRTASITVTSSGLTFGAGTINNLVDGATANNASDSVWISDSSPSAGAYIRFDFGSGNAKYIDEFKSFKASTTGGDGTWRWRASNDASSWTTLGDDFTLESATTRTKAITHASPAVYRYYQMEFVSGSVSNNWQAEFEFKIADAAPAAGDLDVRSAALAAASAPAAAKIVAQIEEVEAITLNTDIIFSVSRDDGTSWSDAVMTERYTAGGIAVIESDEIDLTGQPSGTDMKWRIVTDNAKMVEVEAIALYWR